MLPTTPSKHLHSDIFFGEENHCLSGEEVWRYLETIDNYYVSWCGMCGSVFVSPYTLLSLSLLSRYFSRVVPLLNSGLVLRIVINQIEKLYQCICTRFCILVYKKGNFDIIILFKIESSDHREANHKMISSYNMLFLRINCKCS